ncbi:MAG TPA: glycosyltransferase family A protein [Thermoplasmata archaeon]|nr:glycosyltransferase family A protein [Thermoplasmata archaeon]
MSDETPRTDPVPPVDVLVATFNSARDLAECLESVGAFVPVHRLIVVDRNSTDATRSIAERYGAEVHTEETGLGYARNLALELAGTELVLFVDSDVVLRRPDFYATAVTELQRPGTAAVVGGAVGHPFVYGLPLGLTLFRRDWVRTVRVPPGVQGAETYFLRRAVRQQGLRVRYVRDAMEHRSIYRVRHWPEWQGAQLRIAAGWDLRELVNALAVILLIHLNSRRLRNVLYTPIFAAKLVRGFLAPFRWRNLDRRIVSPAAPTH